MVFSLPSFPSPLSWQQYLCTRRASKALFNQGEIDTCSPICCYYSQIFVAFWCLDYGVQLYTVNSRYMYMYHKSLNKRPSPLNKHPFE